MNMNPIMRFLAKGNKWQFDIPVKEQLDYIQKLPTPKDDFQRSFNQYKAQMLFVTSFKRICLNGICAVLWPILCIFLILKGFFETKQFQTNAIIQKNPNYGVIPSVIIEKYDICKENLWSTIGSLSMKDSGFIVQFLKYYFHSPYFVFKLLFKVALYSQLIRRYEPNTIIVFNEYSFTSSVLTAYCERNSVEHIDIMHGEKLLYIRDSFFRFTRCYIWEDYYKRLFIKLRAFPDQFESAIPPCMKINIAEYKNDSVYSDYKYYLANYTEEELASIVKSMSILKEDNTNVRYRPHPIYSDINLLMKYVPEKDIEYPAKVNIMESIANCKTAIGCYTTVLNQAYHSGVNVVIDDINFPMIFKKLAELEYVLLEKDLKLLSTCIHLNI